MTDNPENPRDARDRIARDRLVASSAALEATIARLSARRATHDTDAIPDPPPTPYGCALCREGDGYVSKQTGPHTYALVPCVCAAGQREAGARKTRLLRRSLVPFVIPFTTPARGQFAVWSRARVYISGFPRPPRPWLVLLGPWGAGKTRYALQIAEGWVDRTGTACLFMPAQTLIRICEDNIGRSYRRETPSDEYTRALETPLLILDDYGAQKNTANADDKLSGLLTERYARRANTVITSNTPIEELPDRVATRLRDPDTVTLVAVTSVNFREHPDQLSANLLPAIPALGSWDVRHTIYNGDKKDPTICPHCQARYCLPSCLKQTFPDPHADTQASRLARVAQARLAADRERKGPTR